MNLLDFPSPGLKLVPAPGFLHCRSGHGRQGRNQ